MLKQSVPRSQRYKGFKVKHIIQICVFAVICIWLLKQVKNTYDENQKVYDNGVSRKSEGTLSEHGVIKLGRKDLDPGIGNGRAEDGGEEDGDENNPEENEEEGRGGGDDEIDGHNQEKAEEESEEVEDLIDEEDKEKENQIEDLSLLEDRTPSDDEEGSQERGDEDSNSAAEDTRSTRTNVQIRRLKKMENREEKDAENYVEQDIDASLRTPSISSLEAEVYSKPQERNSSNDSQNVDGSEDESISYLDSSLMNLDIEYEAIVGSLTEIGNLEQKGEFEAE